MSDGFYLVDEDGHIIGEIPNEFVGIEETPVMRGPSVEADQGACAHPEPLRRPIPGYESDDPNEWECGACGTWQVRDRMAPPGLGPEFHVHAAARQITPTLQAAIVISAGRDGEGGAMIRLPTCGRDFEGHVWNRYYRAGLLMRVECDDCGRTPMDVLGERPITSDKGTYRGTSESRVEPDERE